MKSKKLVGLGILSIVCCVCIFPVLASEHLEELKERIGLKRDVPIEKLHEALEQEKHQISGHPRSKKGQMNLIASGKVNFEKEIVEGLDSKKDLQQMALIQRRTLKPRKEIIPKRPRESIPKLTDDQCLVFYHIPKTGGTSIVAEITTWLPNQQTDLWSWYTPLGHMEEEIAAMAYLGVKRPILFTGHYSYGFGQLLNKTGLAHINDCFEFTLLRHPVDRIISGYFFFDVKANWDRCLNSPMTGGRRLDHCLHFDNDDTRRFSGENALDTYQTRQVIAAIPWSGVTKRHLKQAKENLEKLDVVFINEHMPENYLLLGCRLNIPSHLLPPTPSFVNVNRRSQSVSLEVIANIIENNPLDLELYDYAKVIFARQLRECNIEVPKDLFYDRYSQFRRQSK
jgi:hypothetical protein